jgi:hypothetical protein
MKTLRQYILEAEAQTGTQPFKPNQTMDPQQAAAANKAAQEFMAQLTAKLQALVTAPPTNEQSLAESWLGDKLKAALDWVSETLKSNPLIELGLRLIPPSAGVMAIWDCISALRSGNATEALASLAKVIGGPVGQQLAQAAQGASIGQAVASGDLAGAAQQTANAAGLKDVSQAIGAGQQVASGNIAGAAQTAANAAGLKDVSAGIRTAQAASTGDYAGAATAAGLGDVANGINAVNKGREIARAVTETTELDRILAIARHQR